MDKKKINRSFLALGLILVALIALLFAPAVTAARDGDLDGFDSKVDDCNDKDPAINPDANEICDDGIDNNCNTLVDGADPACGGGVVDTDGDGFADATEEGGITLPGGLIIAGTVSDNYLPLCADPASEGSCVHPDRPDIFVIINRASSGNIPSAPYPDGSDDPLAILRGFINANGDPVVPHEVLKVTSNAPREIADGQNAVVINELLDADFGALGFAPTGGTPNTTSGEVDLYTERIKNEVDRLCSEATICDRNGCADYPVGTCQNTDGSVIGIPGLQKLYIQNVLAHEAWHVCALAPSDNAEVILYHFNPNTGWVMEQSIGSKGTKGKNDSVATVTLYISDTFNSDSRAKLKLK